MERKEAMLKTGYLRMLIVFIVVFLCAVPCIALYVPGPEGETLNVGTGFKYEQIDWVVVNSGGTLNMCPGAYVDLDITANSGSTVNIWDGTLGPLRSVIVTSNLATVTVYGPAFEDSDGIPITTPTWTPGAYNTLTVTDENGDPIFSLQFYSFVAIHLDSTGTLPPEPPINKVVVDIDIKPGSYPNPINPGSNGVIPVAILTTDSFDASTVDPGTVTLAGAEVAVRGKSEKSMARLEDVDGDGDDDLMLQVDTQSEGTVWEAGPVTLTGQTYDGQAIEGTDEVVIVPPE